MATNLNPNNDAFECQRARDPLGTRVHLFLALLWCFFLCWPTTYVEIAWIPLVACCLIRVDKVWPTYKVLVRSRAIWVGLAFYAWWWLALTWSDDPTLTGAIGAGSGGEIVGVSRFGLPALALWPVIDRRRLLVIALALGFLAGNLSQVGQEIGRAFNMEFLTWPRFADRNSGWWKPVVGGSMLVGALGLHVAWAISSEKRYRIVGAAGVLVTLIALVATGTRGAWLAGAGLLVIACSVAAWRLSAARAWKTLGMLGAAAAVGITVGWVALGERIAGRLDEGVREVRTALVEQDYNSFTGARIQMAVWAIEAFKEHPVRGIGPGMYREWTRARTVESANTLSEHNLDAGTEGHDHAHNALLHQLAETGLIGGGLLVVFVVLALREGRRDTATHAPAWILLGLTLVSMFDPVQINQQTSALLLTSVVLCVGSRVPALSKPASAQPV